jgi:hypothetical protein
MPIMPGCRLGQLCIAYTESTGKRSNRPSSIIAVEIARGGQRTRRADQHRRVAIVAAAVHQAALGAAPGKIVLFAHRQGIHVRAQADGPLGLAARPTGSSMHHADHTGLGNAGVHLVHAADPERFSHSLRGAHLFEAEFRVRVQVAPERREFRMHRTQSVKQRPGFQQAGHQWPPALRSTRNRGSTAK